MRLEFDARADAAVAAEGCRRRRRKVSLEDALREDARVVGPPDARKTGRVRVAAACSGGEDTTFDEAEIDRADGTEMAAEPVDTGADAAEEELPEVEVEAEDVVVDDDDNDTPVVYAELVE